MGDIQNGFSDFVKELERTVGKITDERIKIKALEAGAKIVVKRAKRIASRVLRTRTGRLLKSIGAQYSDRSNTMRIGIGPPVSTTSSSTGFYGRFQDKGWHVTRWQPITNKGVEGAWTQEKRKERRTGRFVRNPFIGPAYEAEKDRVFKKMIDVYRKELE